MPHDLWSVFCETAKRCPTRDAFVQGDRHVSFGEWKTQAERVAAALQSRGVGGHDRVMLRMNPSPEMAAVMMGAWAVGAIPVLIDPRGRGRNLAHAVETISPSLALRSTGSPEVEIPNELAVEILLDSELSTSNPGVNLPTEPAIVVFTSGSTGPPKAVIQSHGSVIRACRTVGGYLGLSREDRILCPIPWAFSYGYGQLMFTIVLGKTHILPEAFNPFAICDAIARHRPTLFAGIPSLFTYLLQGLSPFRQTNLSSIRIVTNTGGTIPAPVLGDILDIFDNRKIFLNYGLTESYRTSFLDPNLVRERPTSIGKPIPGVDVAIIGDDGELAEPNEEGMIVHRGDYLFLGYWNDPEATARALRPDPLAPEGCPR